MGELSEDALRRHDESLTRAMREPLPRELRAEIVNLIEPHTMNMYLDHGDTMTCIEVAWPVIRDYFRSHPELLNPERRQPEPMRMTPVRFPPELAEAARQVADLDGMTLSAWIRNVVGHEIGRREGRCPACRQAVPQAD